MSPERKHIVFIGIGGIGMSAIARYFNSSEKWSVQGYDRTRTELTDQLSEEGIHVFYKDDVSWIKDLEDLNPENSIVIYTPAVSEKMSLFRYFKKEGFEIHKRSKALGMITAESLNLSVAGTHGKTTTSCLLSHLLRTALVRHAAFLGGISSNIGSNYYNDLSTNEPSISVTEADEFDRSFLQLKPHFAGITSIDADHLDIYGEHDEMIRSFQEFAQKVKDGGCLWVNWRLQPHFKDQKSEIKTYGIDHGMASAQNVHIHEGRYIFDFIEGERYYRSLVLGIAGRHNVENAVLATSMALKLGISEDAIREGLRSFRGVKRRFEYILKGEHTFIDDYAHHPTELSAFIGSVRQLYPDLKITGIFQPHLFSRTRDFLAEFAESLSSLDDLILLDIYPAREEPLEGITSERILELCSLNEKKLLTKEESVEYIRMKQPELLLSMGAGDIDQLVEPYKDALING